MKTDDLKIKQEQQKNCLRNKKMSAANIECPRLNNSKSMQMIRQQNSFDHSFGNTKNPFVLESP